MFFRNPTAYESSQLTAHWKKYKTDDPSYMELGYEFVNKKNLLAEIFEFWDKIYHAVYWNPKPPSPEDFKFPKNRLLRKEEEEDETAKGQTKKVTPERGQETKPADDNLKPKEDNKPSSQAASEQKAETPKKETVTITTEKKDIKNNDKVTNEQTLPVKLETVEKKKEENPSVSKIKVSEVDKNSENIKKK